MIKFVAILLTFALLTAACQPESASRRPTVQPFPTMTVGQSVRGGLSPENVRPVDTGAIANPATAVALSNRQTPTPDLAACPSTAFSARLADLPETRQEATGAITGYLNAGGSPDDLVAAIANEWEAYDESGYLRDTVDLTGEGTPEVIIGYTAPGDVGTLLVISCENGRFVLQDEIITDGTAPPTIIWAGDVNNSGAAELVYSARQCATAELCEYATQILAWNSRLGRYTNLIDDNLLSLELPQVQDMDDDDVAELVINLNSNGTAATGPLRTGVNIYDWDGSVYTLSIIQLNAPRYRIQVVHQADRAFSQLNFAEAIRLYQAALDDENLRYWFNDGPNTVISYALYRLILAMAVENDPEITQAILRLNTDFPVTEETPLEALPVYVTMAYTFLNNLQETGDYHAACADVLAIVEQDTSALDLLNRYGDRSPRYNALDLCPF